MLIAGSKLGPYEIIAPLGAGGMGEVYRARDTRLGRDVAVKVLPERLSSSPDFRQRFEREARAISSLQHPHICVLHDIGRDETVGEFLVMELLEGETVAERLKRGKLPLPELLKIGMEMADALDKAHRKGLTHRDLKPANIMLTKSGSKLMDFGLAKPAAAVAMSSSSPGSAAPLLSAAVTADGASPVSPITSAGSLVGTIQYMSPEQIEGKEADARSDIFAFGATLYEMATGVRAFQGKSQISVASAILEKDPEPISKTQPLVPATLDRVLAQCLAKNPDERFQSAHDVGLQLKWVAEAAVAPVSSAASAAMRTSPLQRGLPWALAVLGCAASLILLGILWRTTRSAPPMPIELSLSLPAAQPLFRAAGPAVVLSPDGSRIAYVAQTTAGKIQIYVRGLDKPEATPLEVALGSAPFFSPDGQWIGFLGNGGKLQKVSVFGGAPVALCDAGSNRGASWGEDGTIVFPATLTSPLYRISAAGGTPVAVTHLDAGRKEITHRWPQILTGGEAVLFSASADNDEFEHADVEAASLATGQAKVLVENAYFGRYLPSGLLVYVSGGTLFAVPFDVKNLKITGTAMPVLPNIQADLRSGSAQLSFSHTGTAVYMTGEFVSGQVTVALFDRKGAARPLVQQPGNYLVPRFSPDGNQLALQVGVNVWVYDLARGTMTPLTFTPASCTDPVWTPDGKRIACYRPSAGGLGPGISWLPSDGSGSMEPLTRGGTVRQLPSSWSPDGRTLAFFQSSPKTGACCEIWTLLVSPDGQPAQPKPFLGQGSSNMFVNPELSPDGHWMAYTSNESGVPQVYVVPFPGPGGKRQISVTGGDFPRWSKAGHELFFIQAEGATGALISVPYSVQGNSFQPGKPETLFQGGFELPSRSSAYDVAPDGKHFAMFQPVGGKQETLTPPTVVVNWFTRVAQLVAAGQK